MKTLTLIFTLFTISLFAQQDSTSVEVDTSGATVMKTKIEVSRSGTLYTIKQFNGTGAYSVVELTGKKQAVSALSAVLKQLNTDEAALMRELAIVRARQKEVRTARNLYK